MIYIFLIYILLAGVGSLISFGELTARCPHNGYTKSQFAVACFLTGWALWPYYAFKHYF